MNQLINHPFVAVIGNIDKHCDNRLQIYIFWRSYKYCTLI